MGQSLPFAQGFYVSESLPISAQECVNFYPNIPQTGTVTKQSLFGTPGLLEIANADNGESNRGLHAFDGIPYAVNGDTLYRIDRSFDAFGDATYSAVSVGTGLFGDERVIMADNGPVRSDPIIIPSTSITSVTDSDGLARFNFASVGTTITPGTEVVIVDFITNTAYNGTFLVTISDSDIFFETGVAFGTDEAVGSFTGTIAGGAGQICIVIPESDLQFNAFIFTIDGGLNQISDPDFDGPVSSVVYVDGFFLFTKKDGNTFFISAIRNGFSYNALDFSGADVDPDPIRAPFILKNEVFIFGSQTMEPFQNIGGAGFPFIRIEGGVQDKGLDAPFSLVEIDGNMAFIGSADKEDAAIWLSNGGKPQKISSTAIDNQIRTYSDSVIENAFAATYSQSGALFAVFTFPGEETFVYEAVSGFWHTRESTTNEAQNTWRVSNIIQAYGELIVGDLVSNKFGQIDKEVFTEYGELIKRRFVLPPLDNGGNPFFINSIELVGETGQGNTVDPASDPQVLHSSSRDGGRTFGESLSRSFGEKGEYNIRCIWDQLGRVPRSYMPRFEVSDPVKWAFYKVEANID